MIGLHSEGIEVNEVTLQNEEVGFKTKSFLSFVYILRGEGSLVHDERRISFSEGKLFIIPQHENYLFKSENAKLIAIHCPIGFIDKIRLEADRIESCENLYKLQYISNNYHAKAGCVFRDKHDETFAATLIVQIAREVGNKVDDYLIIRNCISILLNLVARNIIKSETSDLQKNRKAFSIMKIITYIQQHIKDREKTGIQAVSEHFGISGNYFGEYFKQQTGVSYQEYLLDYRLKLVETYLKYSSTRLSEIAYELQFSDESHLSKLFKKHRGITPGEYRKKQK
ncbi:AraC family transcriptional regulator [Chryseobacterium indologenes]|uniref:AraC family transcriptional regulator n=1 Tax=Chryseobacterium indologenes TaxID=253 RepID=UPI000B51D057|nr:AraC family transcriptional regulator [Chryseobacterium indologenes]ASE60961.1 AraC family transcriptional regulator [Chryseobacterium indologenes]ATN05071.1 AraC family transcriptional regulator [Chryseobacterium indologenes]AYY86176.1 AraC family transcriptional regulator [Chryseobacterium indologenes]QIX83078.1 AraC family transcriptional regulator [Chryseobacterium indologenes]UDQ52756.1 AraC family transcriptional regulator [Chryseobacterium indologenes]